MKPGKRKKAFVSRKVREKIRIKNRYRRKLRTKKAEWLEACKEVNDAIKQEKEDSWKDLLEGVVSDGDEQKLWSFIKSMNGPQALTPQMRS